MSSKKLVFLIISLSLILCQEANSNKTEEPKQTAETKETKEQPKVETITNTNTNATSEEPKKEANYTHSQRHKQRRDFRSKIPFNMSEDEMDTMMLCTAIVQESVKEKKVDIEALQKKMNLTNVNPIYEKVGTDIFEKCNKNLDIKIVRTFMKNLTYLNNFKWQKEFDELVKVDYDKYNNESDLRLTMEQQILMYKYQRVDELFRQKKADERDNIDRENQKLKIGKIDMDRIPSSVKFMVFLVILVMLFGGVFYLLKTLEKKPKDKKKKEKKKKTQ